MSKNTAKTNEELQPVQIDDITVSTPVVQENKQTKVSVLIPRNDDDESGEKVDPYERVTINGYAYAIKRGERVEVPPAVFVQLRNKFPNL